MSNVLVTESNSNPKQLDLSHYRVGLRRSLRGAKRFLLLDWTENGVQVSSLSIEGQVLECVATEAVSVELGRPEFAEAVGNLLQRMAEQHACRRVFATAPRQWTTIKTITLPELSSGKLNEAIELQMESQFILPTEQLEIDRLIGSCDASAQRYVLLAAMNREHVAAIKAAIERAELELVALSLVEPAMLDICSSTASFGQVEHSSSSNDQWEAIVISGESQTETILYRDGRPLACYTSAHPLGRTRAAATVAASLYRMIGGIGESRSPDAISKIRCLGVYSEEFSQQLASAFPRALVIGDTRDVGLLRAAGVLVANGCEDLRIDFCHPRKCRYEAGHRRRQRLLYGAAVCASVLAAALVNSFYQRALTKELAATQQQVVAVQDELAALQSDLDRASAIERWDESRVAWSRELAGLVSRLPESPMLVVERLDAAAGEEQSPAIELVGAAQSNEAVEIVIDNILVNGTFDRPELKRLEAREADPIYRSDFAVSVSLSDVPGSSDQKAE